MQLSPYIRWQLHFCINQQTLHRKLDGKLDAEKVSYISDEYLKDKKAVSGDYSKEYDETTHTGYIWGKYVYYIDSQENRIN